MHATSEASAAFGGRPRFGFAAARVQDDKLKYNDEEEKHPSKKSATDLRSMSSIHKS